MKENQINILFIEDDRVDVDLIQRIIVEERVPFNLKTADRLSTGLEYITKDKYDLVLLDLGLPDSQGLNTMKQFIRQAPNVPVLVLTGSDDETMGLKAVQMGAQDYLVKGKISSKSLMRCIQYAISRHRLLADLEQKASELQKSEIHCRKIIEENADAIVIVGKDGNVRFVNPASEGLFGRKAKEIVGEKFGFPVAADKKAEIDVIRKDGAVVTAEMRVVETEWGSEPAFLATLRDVTAHKQMIDELEKARRLERHLAYHDALTNLPNRKLLYDRLGQALARAKRYGHKVAVLFLDLDRFKPINDSLGHNIGDRVLKAVAQRLRNCTRESDTVARLGGDEFTVILDHIIQTQDAVKVAQKILRELSEPFVIDGKEVLLTTSIGISLYPNDGAAMDSLVSRADIAMYRAKNQGGNRYEFYNASMDAAAFELLEQEESLRQAIEKNELVLHYQPQVDLSSYQIIGVEALVRWQHPEIGLLAPSKFIALAEETGLIVPLGEWVMRTACVQNKTWQEAGLPPLRVSINLSPRQFRVMRLKETVQKILEETGLRPDRLVLEITESNAMQNVDYSISTLKMLKEMGVQIAIDDFGTGYASLSYLKRFPFDILKIDRSFVKGLHTDHDDLAIVSAIVAMAHSLKLKVLAEGVEDEEQLVHLRSLKCDEFQGFYFSRPVPAESFTELLQAEGKNGKTQSQLKLAQPV
ncbi:MAG: EAL domain-containing protein [bacterium]